MRTAAITEHPVPGKPLGRHVEHDPRSREWPARLAAPAAPLRTLRHRRYGGLFDQGDLGSCTGEAVAGAANTVPVHAKGERVLKQPDALAIYELATRLDGFAGEYPPTDTGSSGLAAAKAAQRLGFVKEYRHAFGIDEAVRALQKSAVATGVSWYEGFDTPTPDGFIRFGGQVRGGHEFLVRGYVAARDPYVLCDQSWGPGFALGGHFKMFVRDWAALLLEDGDCTVLVS